MKSIKYIIVITALCLTSCSEDFIDKKPLDQVVSSNFYQTENDAIEALISVYDAIGYQSTPGISWAPLVTVSDALSDDAFAGGSDANDGQGLDELNTFNIPTTNTIVHSTWLKNYTGIYRANLFLEIIDGIDASDEFKSRTIAEAKFLRAYFYVDLVRFFENIPLITQTLANPSDYSQPQASPQDVYNQIATDLVDAYNVLPDFIPSNETGRVSKWAAAALLARAYLFSNGIYGTDMQAGSVAVNRTTVLGYLEELIASGNHALLEDYADIFRLDSEFSVESVLEIPHGDNPAWFDWGYVRGGEGNLAAQMQGPRVTGSDNWDRGWSFAPVSEDLVVAFGDDPRLSSSVLMESEIDGSLVTGYQHTGYFSKKYSSDAEHWGSDGQFEHNRTCNFRVIRYSDVLLMAAELGSANGQAYFDQIRDRVGLPSIPLNTENLFEERRKEFALEGIRYFDVIRRGVDIASREFNESGIRGANYQGDQVIFDVQFDPATRGFLPIPQREIDLSAGVFSQNTGY